MAGFNDWFLGGEVARNRTDSLALIVHALSPIALSAVSHRRSKNDLQPIWLRSILLVVLIIASYSLQRSTDIVQSAESALSAPPADISSDTSEQAVDSAGSSAAHHVSEDQLENGDIVFLFPDRSQDLWFSRLLSQAGFSINLKNAGEDYATVGIVTNQGNRLSVVHAPVDEASAHQVIEESLADYLSRGITSDVAVYRLKTPTAEVQRAIATAASDYHQKMNVAPLAEGQPLVSLKDIKAGLKAGLGEELSSNGAQACTSLVLNAYLAADVDLSAGQSRRFLSAPLDFLSGQNCLTPESLSSHSNLRLVSQFSPVRSVQSSLD